MLKFESQRIINVKYSGDLKSDPLKTEIIQFERSVFVWSNILNPDMSELQIPIVDCANNKKCHVMEAWWHICM